MMKLKQHVSDYLESLYESPRWYEYVPPLGVIYFHRQKDAFFELRNEMIRGESFEEAEKMRRSYWRAARPSLIIVPSLMFGGIYLMTSGYRVLGALIGMAGVLSWNYSEFLCGLHISKMMKDVKSKSRHKTF